MPEAVPECTRSQTYSVLSSRPIGRIALVDPSVVRECFARQRLLENVQDQDLEELAALSTIETYQPGGPPIIDEGTSPDSVYFILDGSAEVRKQTAETTSTLLKLLHQGDMCGEIAVIRNCLRTSSVIQSEETRCLLVPKEAFRAFLEKHPSADAILKAMIEERLREIYASDPSSARSGVPCLTSLRLLIVNKAHRNGESRPELLETDFKDQTIVELFSGEDAKVARWLSSLGCSSVRAVDIKPASKDGFPGYVQADAQDLSCIEDGSVDMFIVINYLQNIHSEFRPGFFDFSDEFLSRVADQISKKLGDLGKFCLITGDSAEEVTPFLEKQGFKHTELIAGVHEYNRE